MDLFFGSGTSGIEAKNMQRRCIGVELKQEMVDYVSKKFSPKELVVDVNIIQGDSASAEAKEKIQNRLEIMGEKSAQFLILHPPYDDIIKFSDKKEDLSNCATTEEFYDLFKKVAKNGYDLLEKRKFNADNFTDGCVQAILGLGKKVLLADTLALVVNEAYFNRYYFTTWSAIVFILAYAFELYFDFSGYCDIAMGIGKMFNYDIPRNFNYPYRSTSMKEFWNNWHITLGRFFVTYVYIPLGGSRKGTKRKLLNYMVVFLLSGLWHGSSWNYVLWGVLNGLGVIFNNLNLKPLKNRFVAWLCKNTTI